MESKHIVTLGVNMFFSSIFDLFLSKLFSDADCGRGFVRIDDMCLNVSYAAVPKAKIEENCDKIGGKPMITRSASIFFQIRVRNFFIIFLFEVRHANTKVIFLIWSINNQFHSCSVVNAM